MTVVSRREEPADWLRVDVRGLRPGPVVVEIRDGKSYITYTVRQVTGIYDFTLAADPFYEGTEVDTREIREASKPEQTKVEEPKPDTEKIKKQLREMRRAANDKVFV